MNFYKNEMERRKGKWCKEWKRATSVHLIFRKLWLFFDIELKWET
jgi:hypothetical protein